MNYQILSTIEASRIALKDSPKTHVIYENRKFDRIEFLEWRSIYINVSVEKEEIESMEPQISIRTLSAGYFLHFFYIFTLDVFILGLISVCIIRN